MCSIFKGETFGTEIQLSNVIAQDYITTLKKSQSHSNGL